MSHLSQAQLEAYLEKSLPAEERRALWQHCRTCPSCHARLASAADLQEGIGQEVARFSARGDLAIFLPQIMQEARRPLPSIGLKPVALGLLFLFALLICLPLLPDVNVPTTRAEIHNEPLVTATSHAKPPTLESVNAQLQNVMDMNYASPVPPPHATAVASVEPPKKGGG